METGDGYVLRLKPRGGVLDLDLAEALGLLALRYGNGLLDVTARANLQIRGATSETVEPLIRSLADLGLLDPSAGAEAIRNIVSSPLAGLDDRAEIDIRPAITALQERLVGEPALHALPAKWSFAIDDGGALSLADVAADVRFEAGPDRLMHVGLANDPARGLCAPERIADVASALAMLALAARPEPKRMAALVWEQGASALLAAIGLQLATQTLTPRAAHRPAEIVGWHGEHQTSFYGVAPPFGSLKAQDLLDLVSSARAVQARDLRLTPWRVILVTGVSWSSVAALAQALDQTSLIENFADPRLSIAACSGAPACHRATTSTRTDAALLAGLLTSGLARDRTALHVSGCTKGCAHAGKAPWTLVGRGGLYDVIRDGKAGDVPVARGLSSLEAATWISRAPSERVH
jgi:precorrin-3B synthase